MRWRDNIEYTHLASAGVSPLMGLGVYARFATALKEKLFLLRTKH